MVKMSQNILFCICVLTSKNEEDMVIVVKKDFSKLQIFIIWEKLSIGLWLTQVNKEIQIQSC